MNEYSPKTKLRSLINQAIQDGQLTASEKDAILFLATNDDDIDEQEKTLLRSLHNLIENGTIEVVDG